MRWFKVLAFLSILASLNPVCCDIYMHNPRGSNNRLRSAGVNRQNNNRMFDSQNNAKGGYNVGEKGAYPNHHEHMQYHMKYLMSGTKGKGSTYLNIEWTNQHGCGDGDLNCQIVLQYMCQKHKDEDIGKNHIPERKRNGITEATPLYRPHNPFQYKWQKDREERIHSQHSNYGLNEPWNWYDKCKKRSRNRGLFTADQNVKDKIGSTSTRQNPNGQRSGYECPEERDYYPYWHPSDWVDIAVLVDKKSDCPYYQRESFNVKEKGECMERYEKDRGNYKHDSKHNNRQDCASHGGLWVNFHNYLEKMTQYTDEGSCSRAGYKWGYGYRSEDFEDMRKFCFVPLEKPECELAPYSRSNHLGNGAGITPLTYKWKLPNFPSKEEQRCFLRIRYNISTNDPLNKITQNPTVEFLNKLPLRLAINTAQFGRTFQDRSHMFLLTSRDKNGVSNDVNIHNVNIRGKRGNIVQTYPAVEYDFVPKRLTVPTNDAIHVQWTGSNSNPGGNDGQGKAGTDKNNLVEMYYAPYSVPISSRMLQSANILHNFVGGSKKFVDVEASLASAGYYKTSKNAVDKAPRQLDDELNNASPSFADQLRLSEVQNSKSPDCTTHIIFL
ncbi:protein DD3-3-like [Dendronephthya gigantea]|uniref:protein DD3-3-like n=1 Tax=Dendronephthya gigantea TaxID=151771 RepID=UPI00106C3621|nr:protein DD3-3-like [Dendronephthya gigantea]